MGKSIGAYEARGIEKLISECELECQHIFSQIDDVALFNQEKILDAFRNNRVALRHFAPTSGYGYDDVGRITLSKIFAEIFRAEGAIVSPHIASGTHAIAAVLFGILRPSDVLLSISGNPYDTLMPVIEGKNIGSLSDFGVKFKSVEFKDNKFDYPQIENAIHGGVNAVFIQRSGGYNFREAFSIKELKDVILFVKECILRSNAKNERKTPIIIDNCYGEFTDFLEPIEIGANVVVGSLIKNPGGGLAPTGGYICGDNNLIERIEGRITAPGIGCEVGSYAFGYQYFYQGLFMAPHIVKQAMKSATLFGMVFSRLGYKTLPDIKSKGNDIIRSIMFNSSEELISFCQSIQKSSPIDSHVVPEPWDMPGYSHKVIMAAGAFVQGASIELSADSPIKAPYIAYLQGALTYEHAKIALKNALTALEQSNQKS